MVMPTRLRSLTVLMLALVGLLVIVRSGPEVSEGLRAEPRDGSPPTISCGELTRNTVYVEVPPGVVGDFYFTGREIDLTGVAQVTRGVPHRPSGPCLPQIMDLPTTSWALTRPPGSAANVQTIDLHHATLLTDVEGDYVVRYTACPNTCALLFPNNLPETFQPLEVQVTIMARDDLPFPPQYDPVVPDLSDQCGFAQDAFAACVPNDMSQSVVEEKCANGGGILDPQWVTVNEWFSQLDYHKVEGRVFRSNIPSRASAP